MDARRFSGVLRDGPANRLTWVAALACRLAGRCPPDDGDEFRRCLGQRLAGQVATEDDDEYCRCLGQQLAAVLVIPR